MIRENAFWIIESGSVDLVVHEKDSFKTLITFETGGLFFSFAKEQNHYRFFFKPSKNAKLKEVLAEKIGDADFEKWILSLYSMILPLSQENIDFVLSEEKESSFEITKKSDIVALFSPSKKESLLWLKIIKGELSFLGQSEILLKSDSPFFPLCHKAFFSTSNSIILKTVKTESLLFEEKISAHRAFLDAAITKKIELLEKRKKDEISRVLLKKKREKLLLKETWREISSIFEKKKAFHLNLELPSFFQALQILGNLTQITFKFPKELDSSLSREELLYHITENSSVRFRRVELEGKWWKKDFGPLLGFFKDRKEPIVLNRKNGSYQLFDPLTEKTEKITDAINETIATSAYEFYPTLQENSSSVKKILRFCFKGRSKDIVQWILMGALAFLLALFIPFASSFIFNNVIPYSQDALLKQIAFGLFVVAISTSLFSLLFSFMTLRFQMIFNLRLQTALWSRLLNLPIPFFRNNTTGDLIKRVFSISTIQTALSSSVFYSLFAALFSLFYLIIMFYFSLQLAFFSLLLFAFSILINALFIRRKVKVETKSLEQEGLLKSFILQVIGGIEKIRLSGAENIILARFGRGYAPFKESNLKSNKISNLIETFNSFIPLLGLFGNFLLGYHLLVNQRLTLGDFIAYIASFNAFSIALTAAFSTMSSTICTLIPQWSRAKIIFETPEESRLNKLPPGKLIGSFEVDNVFFRYGESGPLVLKGVSLNASPGEFVAVVGPSGSGKSTLVSLLLQFNLPLSGSILYSGKDLSELDILKVRKQLGVVLQESDILSGTIEDNLISAGGLNREKMEEVFRLSGFDKVLKEMPLGIKTYLVDNGKNLSGGQKQQLLIARALLVNPKILIFDEVTNALDNHSQELISENLNKLKITRFVIAHRLSTIVQADRIYVLEKGKIVQSGTFDQLAAQEGLFASMLERQKL